MTKIYNLRTHCDTKLVIRIRDRLLVHVADSLLSDEFAEAFVYISSKNNFPAFLLCNPAILSGFICQGCAWDNPIKIFTGIFDSDKISASFFDPWREEFLSAIPGEDVGQIIVDRQKVGPWEIFALEEVGITSNEIFEVCERLNQSICAVGQPSKRFGIRVTKESNKILPSFSINIAKLTDVKAKDFIKLIDRGVMNAHLTQSLGRDLPLAECQKLAAAFAGNPRLEEKFLAANPNDLWAQQAIPSLNAWLGSGRQLKCPIRSLGAEFDTLEWSGRHGKIWSFTMLMNALRRDAVIPKKKACILATARNEGVYFIEWIAHHRALGFEDFFIYTNDNSDGSDHLLESLASAGIINLIHNHVLPPVSPQYKAYGHALQFLPEILDYEWVAAIDLDEFIRIDPIKFHDICEYLQWHSEYSPDSIGLSWRMYGPNKQIFWADEYLSTRFPEPEPDGNQHIKSIFKPKKFFHSQCHFPYHPPYEARSYRTSARQPSSSHPFDEKPNYDYAWIDHYHLKSLEEMVVRRVRNRGDMAVSYAMDSENISQGLVQLFLHRFYSEPTKLRLPDDQLNEKRQFEINYLTNLPGVADALERCKLAFKTEISRAREILAQSPRFRASGSPEKQLTDLLLGG